MVAARALHRVRHAALRSDSKAVSQVSSKLLFMPASALAGARWHGGSERCLARRAMAGARTTGLRPGELVIDYSGEASAAQRRFLETEEL